VTRIDTHTPTTGQDIAGRGGFSWASWLIVLAGLAAQLWVVTNVSEPGRTPPEPGRTPLLIGSILFEYAAIAWCERRAV